MDKKYIASRLVKLAMNIISSDTKKAFGIVKNPERLKKLMKDRGFTMDKDGKVYFYPFTALGYFDISRPPQKAGDDIEAAIRRDKHIIDDAGGLKEKIENHKKLLDSMARLINSVRNNSGQEEINDYRNDIEKFINNKVRDGDRKRVNELITDISKDSASRNESGVKEAGAKLEALVWDLINKWQKQVDSISKRKAMLFGVRNMLRNDPLLLQDIMSE